MKAILFSLFLLPAAGLFAQNDFIHVDYEQIGQAISDSNSVYYYPRLLELYKSGDTTLTTLDYFHLYYGATLQDDWSSMQRFEDEEARRILRKTSADPEELQMVKKALEEYLAQAPFDLDQIYDLMVVTDQLGQTEEFEVHLKHIQGLLAAIMETGDGLTGETAIHVNKVPDEYFVLNIIGFAYGGEQALFYPCDYLSVKKNEYDVEGLYFNVQQHFKSLEKILGNIKVETPIDYSKEKKKKGKKN